MPLLPSMYAKHHRSAAYAFCKRFKLDRALLAKSTGTKMWSWYAPATTLQLIASSARALEKAAVNPEAFKSECTFKAIQAQRSRMGHAFCNAWFSDTTRVKPSTSLKVAIASRAPSA